MQNTAPRRDGLPNLETSRPRKGLTFRQGAVFAAGLLLGAAVTAWIVSNMRVSPEERARYSAPTPQPEAVAVTPRPTAVAAPAPVAMTPSPAVVAAARPHASCPAQPMTTPAVDAKDGQIRFQTTLSAKTPSDVSALILDGKEAAASGRPRDAEVAFMMACMVADRHGPGSASAADARYQLGRHYANLALGSPTASATKRTELLRRAEILYSDSAQTYVARNGKEHEKSRFAADGLAAVRQTLAQSGQAPTAPAVAAAPAPAPARVAIAPPTPPVALAPVTAPRKPVEVAVAPRVVVPEPARQAPPPPLAVARPAPSPAARTTPPAVARSAPPAIVARVEPAPTRQRREAEPDDVIALPVRQATGDAMARPRPSFDCGKARSPSERAICSDSQLSQLDRDLGRLHSRAKNAAPDGAAFRRQNDTEWRWRESTCRGDRDCLLRWYAHRRDQLLDDITDSGDRRQSQSDR